MMRISKTSMPGGLPDARYAARVAMASLLLLLSAAGMRAQDVAGISDHPTISRYAGSVIIGYDVRKFDEFVLPLSPVQITPPNPPAARKTLKLEGRVTRIVYVAPPERSSLEVLRNYQQELQKSGFETLFTCATTTCSSYGSGLTQALYPQSRSGTLTGQDLPLVLTMPQEERYLAAKRTTVEGDTYASVFVAKDTNPGVPRTFNRTVVLLEVIETAPMDAGLVTVDAAAMAKAIAQTGHVALYGIYFDTNKAELKPASQTAIEQIAKLLKQDPMLRLLVVGHTDNVGGYDTNTALSERRAAAVLQELTSKHAIPAARLRGVGVGMAAPVAPNETEEGRGKNRRVELVKQ